MTVSLLLDVVFFVVQHLPDTSSTWIGTKRLQKFKKSKTGATKESIGGPKDYKSSRNLRMEQQRNQLADPTPWQRCAGRGDDREGGGSNMR